VRLRYLDSAADVAEGGAAAGGGAGDERRVKAAEKAAADASKQLETVKGRLKEAEERVKVLEKEAKAAAKAVSSGGGGGEFSAKDKIMLEKKVGQHINLVCRVFMHMLHRHPPPAAHLRSASCIASGGRHREEADEGN
jgi:hypothetical protein